MLDMVQVDSIYLHRDLNVQHCRYFLIHMVLLYSKIMFVLRVYQQNILYLCRIWGFFCNIVRLSSKTYKGDTFLVQVQYLKIFPS